MFQAENASLMAIVPLHSVYVVANYKETQLTNVRPGQPVDFTVDTFPGQVVHGVVDSIAPASGQEFALLPPDNATGNFTKIVQRIPVKILLRNDTALAGLLRAGHVGRADHRHQVPGVWNDARPRQPTSHRLRSWQRSHNAVASTS